MPVKKPSPSDAPLGEASVQHVEVQGSAAPATAVAEKPRTAPKPEAPRQGLAIVPSIAAPELRSAASDLILSRGGRLPRVATEVTLYKSKGHIFSINDGEDWMLTADGYMELNKVNGLQFVPMPEVSVEGDMQPNPHVVYSYVDNPDNPKGPKLKVLEGIYIRGALIGRDLLGSVRIVQETFFFSPKDWLYLGALKLCDWRKPQKRRPKKGQDAEGMGGDFEEPVNPAVGNWTDCGQIVSTASVQRPLPRDMLEIPIIPGLVSAILDLREYRVRKLMENYISRQRDFSRIAHTILMRRLFRAHPGCEGQRLRSGTVKVKWEERTEYWPSGDVKGKKDVITEAWITIPALGWIDDAGKVESKLIDQLRRGQDMMAEATVQDLGQADVVKEEAEEEVGEEGMQDVGTEDAGETDAHKFAAGALGQLAKLDGGKPFADDLRAKFCPNGATIASLSAADAGRLVDAINNAIENLRERQAMQKGGGK